MHAYQGIFHCTHYTVTVIMGGLLQTVAFIARVLSINLPTSLPLYSTWFVLVFIALLFVNAFVYMIMGRMVHNFLPQREVGGVSARRLGLYFMSLDLV